MNNPLDELKTLEETASYICTKLKENAIDAEYLIFLSNHIKLYYFICFNKI